MTICRPFLIASALTVVSGCGLSDALGGFGSPFAQTPSCSSGDESCFCSGPSCQCTETNCSCREADLDCARSAFFEKDGISFTCTTTGDALCICGDALDGCGCSVNEGDAAGTCALETGSGSGLCQTSTAGSNCLCTTTACECPTDDCDSLN